MFILLRTIHILLGSFFLSCLIYLYYAAFSETLDSKVYFCLAALIIEGLILLLFRGCPLTYIQNRSGDSKGFFDLFMPKSVLPFVVPLLTLLTLVALILIYFKHLNG